LLATAGCTQLATGDASFSAGESSVDGAEEYGYELNRTEWQNITRNVEAGGQEREITVNNRIQLYLNQSGDGTPEGAFAVVTSPQIQVAGQAMNPVGDWDNEQILEEFGSEFDSYGSIEDLEERDTETMTILDTETEVTTFEATVSDDSGETRTAVVRVTSVQHDGDIVIAVGVHDVGDEANAEDIQELFVNLEH
jgi:hypothetical protein